MRENYAIFASTAHSIKKIMSESATHNTNTNYKRQSELRTEENIQMSHEQLSHHQRSTAPHIWCAFRVENEKYIFRRDAITSVCYNYFGEQEQEFSSSAAVLLFSLKKKVALTRARRRKEDKK